MITSIKRFYIHFYTYITFFYPTLHQTKHKMSKKQTGQSRLDHEAMNGNGVGVVKGTIPPLPEANREVTHTN